MVRLIRFLIALLFVAAGVAVGALNPQPVSIDLGFAVLRGTLGLALLATLLVGALLGGMMLAASVILSLRRKLRRSRMQAASSVPPASDAH